ncbi:hypothetical protein [Fodinibius sp. AD559]|uniref:hypothetical protein n=1 Tax=Fodinibius sp. AD559 TaxID=3424179 RepID=UPI004046CB0C
MSTKLTWRQRLKFAATASLMFMGVNSQVQAQQGAQAVMAVTVRVIDVPAFVDNIIPDITDQLQEKRESYILGDQQIIFPEGTGYSVSFDPVIEMKGKNSSWDLNASVDQHTDSDGKLTLTFSGKPTAPSVVSDHYAGELTTQIEYH